MKIVDMTNGQNKKIVYISRSQIHNMFEHKLKPNCNEKNYDTKLKKEKKEKNIITQRKKMRLAKK